MGKGTAESPVSRRCIVLVLPERGWPYGPSSGCSRLFGKAPGMRCSPEAARVQLLALLVPQVGNWWGGRLSLIAESLKRAQ